MFYSMKKVLLSFLLSVCSILLTAQSSYVITLPCDKGTDRLQDGEKESIREELASAMNASGKSTIVSADVDLFLNDSDFARDGELSDYNVYKLSKLVAADNILVSYVEKKEDVLILMAHTINIETMATSKTVRSIAELVDGQLPPLSSICHSVVKKLFTTENKPSNASHPAPVEKKPQIATNIGQVITFSDGTVGLCFFLNRDGHGLAISMDQDDRAWDINRGRNIMNVIGIPDQETLSVFVLGQGQIYTDSILSQLSPVNAPAAAWCRMHGPNWYLPSAEELFVLLFKANGGLAEYGVISKALVRAGGKALDQNWYWSSTENDRDEAINVSSGGRVDSERKKSEIAVRAVRAF